MFQHTHPNAWRAQWGKFGRWSHIDFRLKHIYLYDVYASPADFVHQNRIWLVGEKEKSKEMKGSIAWFTWAMLFGP